MQTNQHKLIQSASSMAVLGALPSAFGLFPLFVSARTYSRVIKLVLPVATGSGVDTIVRTA